MTRIKPPQGWVRFFVFLAMLGTGLVMSEWISSPMVIENRLREWALFCLKLFLLAGFLFGLLSIDFVNLSLIERTWSDPFSVFLTAFLNTLVLSYAVITSRWHGFRLWAALFAAFFGISTVLVVVEASYLANLVPLVPQLLVNGGITAGLFSLVAVLVHARMEDAAGKESEIRFIAPTPRIWILKTLLLALFWVFLFVGFGAGVFLPLANWLDPQALAGYSSLDMPDWILLFQAGRGLLWIALSYPLLFSLRQTRQHSALGAGLLFAVLMGSNLLMAGDLPQGLKVAHLVEVMGANFIFGCVVYWALLIRDR